jgi:hypothetical protein
MCSMHALTHRRLFYPRRSCVPAELRCVSNSERILTLRRQKSNSLNTGAMPKKIPRATATPNDFLPEFKILS